MIYEESINVLKTIEKNGYEAYIVGGFSRDLYLNKKTTDIDITTNAKPSQIKKIFKNYMIKETNYGNITIKINNQEYEITTFRKEENYKNNRHPDKIKYIKNLYQDLQRRDFTINTLCIDSNKQYIDYLNSIEDIKKNIIKCVGNSDKKIKEDSLRILRAIRFATTLNFKLDENLIKAIMKYKKNLISLSQNRKKEELDKIFDNSNNEYGINLIKKLKLEQYLNINLKNIIIAANKHLIWAQQDISNYTFTKKEKTIIENIKKINTSEINNETLYKYDLETVILAAQLKDISKATIEKKYKKLPIKNKNDINITIEEIKTKFDVPYEIANILIKKIENNILNETLNNTKNEIIDYLKGEI